MWIWSRQRKRNLAILLPVLPGRKAQWLNNHIADMLQSWTKAVETLPEKDLFGWMREFFNLQFSHFNPLSPFQCCNHVTVSTERNSTLKRGRGGFGYQQKSFLKLRKDADRKRLFCSNVSTLFSMIVDAICSDNFFTIRTSWSFSQSFNLNILQDILLHCQPSTSPSIGRQFFAKFKSFVAEYLRLQYWKLCMLKIFPTDQQTQQH